MRAHSAVHSASTGHELATVLSVVELLSAPHEKCPSAGFDLLMRQNPSVEAMELHTITSRAMRAPAGRRRRPAPLRYKGGTGTE